MLLRSKPFGRKFTLLSSTAFTQPLASRPQPIRRAPAFGHLEARLTPPEKRVAVKMAIQPRVLEELLGWLVGYSLPRYHMHVPLN